MSLTTKLLEEDFSRSLKALDYNLEIHCVKHAKAEFLKTISWTKKP